MRKTKTTPFNSGGYARYPAAQPSRRRGAAFSPEAARRRGGQRGRATIMTLLVVVAAGWFLARSFAGHAVAAGDRITSGLGGYCLDDHKHTAKGDTAVEIWQCNGSAAQAWTVTDTTITHDKRYCLTVQGNVAAPKNSVTLSNCNNAPSQIWLRGRSGYQNPDSGRCLAAAGAKAGARVVAVACDSASQNQIWRPTSPGGSTASPKCNAREEGEQVACYAAKEWTAWQTNPANHANLLNQYSDGNGYEEWCADFVSYVYKEAGYPFANGERGDGGWDEYDATNLQNMGFAMHAADSGYVPQAGDVAFFDYSGGHVEIVVSGGEKPTFIYGDSARIDPLTGNGDMAANTITNDGDAGQVVYYLSPN